MQAVQLQKEIADLKRRVSNAKFRVDNETKVSNLFVQLELINFLGF